MRSNSIFQKTLAYSVGLLLVVVMLIHLIFYFGLPPVYEYLKVQEINHAISQIVSDMREYNEREATQYLGKLAQNSPYYFIFSRENRVYYYKNFLQYHINLDENIDSLYLNIVDEDFFDNSVDQLLQRVTYLNEDQQVFTLQLVSDLQPIDEAKSVIVSIFPFSIGLSLLISFIGAWIYSRNLTKPIEDMEEETQAMMHLDANAHVKVASQDEIGLLGESINQLYQNLLMTIQSLEEEIHQGKTLESQQMNFFRTASHELKTPLASLSVIIENVGLGIGKFQDKEKYLGQCLRIIESMTDSINSLLKETQDFQLDHESVIVNDLLKETLNKYEIIQRSRNLSLDIHLDQVVIDSNREALSKVFSNLIHNAYVYGEADSEITIHLNSDCFSIYNQGQSLTAEQVQSVFQPFYSADEKRAKSTGLGLSLVAYWLTRLQMTYDFKARDQGMEFTIYFRKE